MRPRQSQAQAVMDQPELGLGMPRPPAAPVSRHPGQRPSQGRCRRPQRAPARCQRIRKQHDQGRQPRGAKASMSSPRAPAKPSQRHFSVRYPHMESVVLTAL